MCVAAEPSRMGMGAGLCGTGGSPLDAPRDIVRRKGAEQPCKCVTIGGNGGGMTRTPPPPSGPARRLLCQATLRVPAEVSLRAVCSTRLGVKVRIGATRNGRIHRVALLA